MKHQMEALNIVLLNVVFPMLAAMQVSGWIEKYLTERKKSMNERGNIWP